MRASIFALLMALPIAGFAQTPRDLAHLSFGTDVPAVVSQPPSAQASGAATGLDLARLSGVSGTVVSGTSNPHFAAGTTLTGADIARLRGDGVPAFGLDTVGVRIVAAERPHG
jgi:hypothetical protein